MKEECSLLLPSSYVVNSCAGAHTDGEYTEREISMGFLQSVLISFLSTPFSSLFVFLTQRLHGAQYWSPSPAAPDDRVALPPWEASPGVSRYESSSSSSSSGSSGAVECVFCLCSVEEGEEVRELRCMHLFHQRCLDRWLAHRRATCPLCRDPLVPQEAAAGNGSSEEEEEEEELGDVAGLVLANCAPCMVNWY